MPAVLDLAQCANTPVSQIGGKAAGSARLIDDALDVPPGFVVTTDAYREWIAQTGAGAELARLVASAEDPAGQGSAAQAIAALFERSPLSDPAIDAAYAALPGSPAAVAVRSSATAEDLADASFAGQQETYLWIVGADAIRRHIVRCWASLFSAEAISYRRHLGADPEDLAMAVVVQQMVAAETAGVMFTLDPLTGDRSQITIEGVRGLGLPLVGGELNPDRFCVDKVTFEIRTRSIAAQPFADRIDPATDAVRRVDLPGEEAEAPCLGDDEVVALAELGKRVERTMGRSVDVEWALGPGPEGPRQRYLLQARPETVWSGRANAAAQAPEKTGLAQIAAALGTRN